MLVHKLVLYMEGKQRLKKETNLSRLVGGKFSKQENWLTRLAFCGNKTSRSPHLPAKMSTVYVEALIWLGHVFSPDGGNSGKNSTSHEQERG